MGPTAKVVTAHVKPTTGPILGPAFRGTPAHRASTTKTVRVPTARFSYRAKHPTPCRLPKASARAGQAASHAKTTRNARARTASTPPPSNPPRAFPLLAARARTTACATASDSASWANAADGGVRVVAPMVVTKVRARASRAPSATSPGEPAPLVPKRGVHRLGRAARCGRCSRQSNPSPRRSSRWRPYGKLSRIGSAASEPTARWRRRGCRHRRA